MRAMASPRRLSWCTLGRRRWTACRAKMGCTLITWYDLLDFNLCNSTILFSFPFGSFSLPLPTGSQNYFLDHGVTCLDDVPNKDSAEHVIVNYMFVLTQQVADYYTAPNGPISKKMEECKVQKGQESGLISVITRLDRCYDMEVGFKLLILYFHNFLFS